MKQSIKYVLLAVLSAFVSMTAFAQITTSGAGGRVTDESEAPVIGAVVIATHTPSGTRYNAVTNAEGRYTINGMRAGGPYSFEVSCLGYRTVTYTDITLSLAENYALNVVLQEDKEMLTEAVVVAAPTSKFAGEKTGAATNISSQQITNMPTISRSITDVARLSPYGGNGMSFAGADGRTANFTVDGANFNNNFGLSSNLPGGGSPISIDALEEIQVVISPYDVRQTDFIGGGINAITKSGTNTLKGSAYVYHKNENMRGNAVDGDEISGARDKDRKTTVGFTLGGPIIKNKLFFFVNAEFAKIPTVVNRWQATSATSSSADEYGMRQGTMNADAYQSITSLEDMQKVSDFVKQKYGYDTGSYTNFPANESNRKILARVDWNINDNNHLAVRYNYTLNQAWNSPNSSSMDGGTRSAYGRMSKYSMSFANSMYSQDNLVHSFSFDLNSRISDNLSNQFLATFSKLDDVRGTNSDEFPFIDIRNGDESVVTPYMALGYELFTWNNAVHNTIFNAKDNLTWYKGNHKITAGASWEYQMADNAYMRNGTGYYRYYSLADFLNGANPEVVCLTYGYDGEDNPAARVRYQKMALYGQDEWAVNDKLKLTYGLRLDGIVFNNSDIMTNNAILALDYDGKSVDTGKWPTSKVSVSPRVGFNWDVLGDKSLKVRGGTGLFQGRLPLVFFTNMPTNSGMVQYQAKLSGSAAAAVVAGYNGLVTDANGKATVAALRDRLIALGYPSTVTPEDGTVSSSFAAVDPKFKMPQVWKTSLAVDYSFPTSFPFSVSAEGIFNKTVNAVCISDWSVKPVSGFARFNGVDDRPIYPSSYKYTYVNASGKTVNMPNAYVLTNTSKGYGWSGSFTVNMQPTKEIRLMASYTHTASKELTGMPGSDASSAFTYIPTYEGPNNARLHNSQYVTPDRIVANAEFRDHSNNLFSFIYEAIRGGNNYTYMTVNDMNGDGYNYDVIYIPSDRSQLHFVSTDDADRFWGYVDNDKYLSKLSDQYTEAYSVYSPWYQRLDFHYAHDFKIKVGNTKNTLQLNFDVKNLLNLFNSSWGVIKYMNSDLNSGRILKYEGVDANGYPTYSTPAAVSASTKTWQYTHAIGQCWYAQIGLKYMFN